MRTYALNFLQTMATEGRIRARENLTVDEVIEGVFADDDSEQEDFFLNQTVIVRRVSLVKILQPKKKALIIFILVLQ